MVLYFWAYLVDNGKESSEKYQVIVPRAAGSDLPDRRRIEHAVALHVRVTGYYPCQHSDDCPRAGVPVCRFLLAPDQA